MAHGIRSTEARATTRFTETLVMTRLPPVTATTGACLRRQRHDYHGSGDDRVYAGDGDDWADLGSGEDTFFGQAGQDTAYGRDGSDELTGGTENDWLEGGSGDDDLLGDEGRDVLWGGTPPSEITRDSFYDFVMPPLWVALEDEDSEAAESFRTPWPMDWEDIRIVPSFLDSQSFRGTSSDGSDTLYGGPQDDWLFGGGDSDLLHGDAGNDFVDAGGGHEKPYYAGGVYGDAGHDVLFGGDGNDELHGGSGIDQLYGDDGEIGNPLNETDVKGSGHGDDILFADAGYTSDNLYTQHGQRLFGGGGNDKLYAYAPSMKSVDEAGEDGDQLFGGLGNDWLHGNLRQEVLIGGPGSDNLFGDGLTGPTYADNVKSPIEGGSDLLMGGGGVDKLYGGGGNDTLWGGGDSDHLEGQDGFDQLYGGSWTDELVLDTTYEYTIGDTTYVGVYTDLGDALHGHFGNSEPGTPSDDNATDIVRVNGTSGDDTIQIGETEVAVIASGDCGEWGDDQQVTFSIRLNADEPVELTVTFNENEDLVHALSNALKDAQLDARIGGHTRGAQTELTD